MTFVETLLLIEERKETILFQDSTQLITAQHRYHRIDNNWTENATPGIATPHYGKEGMFYSWQTIEQ